MNKWTKAGVVLALSCVAFSSCSDIFTTSTASALERDSPGVSSSASVSDLMDIANSNTGANPEVAKEILDILADKKPSDLTSLSIEDKTAILNLAGTATIPTGTITALAQDITEEGADSNALVEEAIGRFDSSVNLTAIEVLLSDPETLESASEESLVFASAAVLADVANEVGADVVMEIMADPSLMQDSDLSQDQKDQINLVINVLDVIDSRPAEDGQTSLGDFTLTDLLRGNKT